MIPYTHIVWDFNGTLYDDVEACIQSANRLLCAHALLPFKSVEDYRAMFGFPIIEYYRRMGFDFDKTPYDDLAVEWIEYYMEASRTSPLYTGTVETLEMIKALGVTQILLSATERDMLGKQIETLGIKDYFDEMIGQDSIHAYGKAELGCMWRQRHPSARILLIGDTEHDAEVAEKINADFLLVSFGHRPQESLKMTSALGVLNSHAELQRWLKEYA